MPAIDFITLSRTPPRIPALSQSIRLAMGGIYPHNLTVMDGNKYDLFTGYNAAAAQTKGDILIFVHDDVLFLGNALTFAKSFQMLEDPGTGFIGVCGTRHLESTGIWWGGNLTREQTFMNCRGMLLHESPNEFAVRAAVWPTPSAEFGRVLVIDGVLMMCHRRTFNRLGGFDAGTYQGFHFYDIDTSFRAHQLGLRNYAAPVPIVHPSVGDFGPAWEKNRAVFAEKFGAALPCTL